MAKLHSLPTNSQPTETTIHKSRALANFTLVPNSLAQDENLSITARGVLIYLLSLPKKWEIRMDTSQTKTGLGRDRLRRAFRELARAGHMHRFAISGRTSDSFSGSRWHVFADPADLAEILASPATPKGFIGDRLKTRTSVKQGDVHKETVQTTKTDKAPNNRPIPPPAELAAFLAANNLSDRIATVYFASDDAYQSFPTNADGSTPPDRDWRAGLLSFARSSDAA